MPVPGPNKVAGNSDTEMDALSNVERAEAGAPPGTLFPESTLQKRMHRRREQNSVLGAMGFWLPRIAVVLLVIVFDAGLLFALLFGNRSHPAHRMIPRGTVKTEFSPRCAALK